MFCTNVNALFVFASSDAATFIAKGTLAFASFVTVNVSITLLHTFTLLNVTSSVSCPVPLKSVLVYLGKNPFEKWNTA